MKRHYRAIIVACAFLLLFVNVGFTSTSFSIYQSHIVDLPGVGDVGGSVVVTVRTFIALICMFFTGFYYRRLDPRIGFFIATLFTVLAFVLFGYAQTLAGLCFASLFAGIGYGLGGMVASTFLIGNWFRGKVGSVSGIATMGSGVAAIVIPLLAGWLIDAFSLSISFYVEAAIAFVIAITLLIFVRAKPEDVGIKPFAAKEKARHFHRVHHSHHLGPFAQPKVSLSIVPLPKVSYFAMIIAIVLLGGVSVAGYNYFGILLTTQGIDLGVTAILISLAGVFLTLSKFIVGVVCDKFGTLNGSFLFFILLTLAMLLCSLIGSGGVPEAAAAAVILGIGMPLGTTGIALWSLELSSAEQMLKTIRHFQLAAAFGGFIFNLMPGVLCALTGTYTTSYFVMMGMTIACAIIVLTVYAHHITRSEKAAGEESLPQDAENPQGEAHR